MVVSRRDTVVAFLGDTKNHVNSSLESNIFNPTRNMRESLAGSMSFVGAGSSSDSQDDSGASIMTSFRFSPRRTESGSVNPFASFIPSMRSSRMSQVSTSELAEMDISQSIPETNGEEDEDNPQSGDPAPLISWIRRQRERSSQEENGDTNTSDGGKLDPITSFLMDRLDTFGRNIEVLTGKK